jgi:DNA repair exonuclease SbcCD nuclease subunit
VYKCSPFSTSGLDETIEIIKLLEFSMDVINIVFFSDTHLGFDFPLRPRVKKRRRGEDFFRNFESVLSYAKINNCDMVIHGGDLFYRSKVPQPIVDRTYQILTHFANSGMPIFIVPGNHERSQLPTSIFLNHPNLYVFNKPGYFTQTIRGIQIGICGLPFIRGNIDTSFKSVLIDINWYCYQPNIKILALHQAVEGASVGPKNYTFRRGEDVIALSSLPEDATLILCGHIHRQQILTKLKKGCSLKIPVIFCGSTERTSFAEKDEAKGFYHLIFANSKENRWRLIESRFIILPTRPMVDISVDPHISTKRFKSYLKEKICLLNPNSIIRFRSDRPIHQNLRKLLTTKELSQLFPSTMNYTFSIHLYNRDLNYPKNNRVKNEL